MRKPALRLPALDGNPSSTATVLPPRVPRPLRPTRSCPRVSPRTPRRDLGESRDVNGANYLLRRCAAPTTLCRDGHARIRRSARHARRGSDRHPRPSQRTTVTLGHGVHTIGGRMMQESRGGRVPWSMTTPRLSNCWVSCWRRRGITWTRRVKGRTPWSSLRRTSTPWPSST